MVSFDPSNLICAVALKVLLTPCETLSNNSVDVAFNTLPYQFELLVTADSVDNCEPF